MVPQLLLQYFEISPKDLIQCLDKIFNKFKFSVEIQKAFGVWYRSEYCSKDFLKYYQLCRAEVYSHWLNLFYFKPAKILLLSLSKFQPGFRNPQIIYPQDVGGENDNKSLGLFGITG
jgi:hypothetical protein